MPYRDVVGHRKVVALLARAVRRGTLPPTLLFAGPPGVGKRLTALATAQALNCTDIQPATEALELDACGRCATCTRIARGTHPAVLAIEAGDTGSIRIEPVRDVIDRAAYRPFEGRRRVVIVDPAEALVPAAQNALLKTLEEPPPASVFLLVTAKPDALLPTVRSRCPRLPFRPLSTEEVAETLTRRGRPRAEATAIARTAAGSVGRALESSGEAFTEARDVAVQVLTSAARATDAPRRLAAAKDLLAMTGSGGAGDREQVASHLRAMASLIRDVALVGAGGDRASLANADAQPALDRLTAFQGERGVQAFAAVDRALLALERNAGVKIVADWLVLQL